MRIRIDQGKTDAYRKRIREQENMSKLARETAPLNNHGRFAPHTVSLVERMEKTGAEVLAQKRLPVRVDSVEFHTSSDLRLADIPIKKDWNYSKLNFAFGKSFEEERKNYEDMISTPKYAFSYSKFEYKINDINYNVLKIYAIAPFLKNQDLPVIYRLDILSNPKNPNFHKMRGVAVVGGAVDGDCPLFQVNLFKTEKNSYSKIYEIKSGKTSFKIDDSDEIENTIYKISKVDEVVDLPSMGDYVLDHFNIKNIFRRDMTNKEKLGDILDIMRSNRVNNLSESLENPNEMIEKLARRYKKFSITICV